MVRNKNFVLNYIMTVVLLILTLTLFLSFNEYNLVTKDEVIESIAAPTNSDNWQDNSSYRDTSWSGSGNSENDPYLITSAKELAGLAYQVNAGNTYSGKYFKQTCDIDLSAHYWTPIGTKIDNLFKKFYGEYDGNNYIVSGIYTVEGNDYQGLFGITDSAKICNIGIETSSIVGEDYVGGIVGSATSSSIINCHNISQVSGAYNVGGIAGRCWTDSEIIDCYNLGSINSLGTKDTIYAGIGGIVGDLSTSNISNCYNVGNITGGGEDKAIGGIVGDAGNIGDVVKSISSCYNLGIVRGFENVGGIVGSNGEDTIVKDCYNKGNILGDSYVGGIVGSSYGGNTNSGLSIIYCYNTADIEGIDNVGGILGYTHNSYVYNSYNIGSVIASETSGGIIGFTTDNYYYSRSCYYGGNCTLSYGIGNISGVGPSNSNTTKIENLNSTLYVKNMSWYTNSSNWSYRYSYGNSWDFTNTWAIDSSINDGYPYLKNIKYTYNIEYNYNGGSAGDNSPSTADLDEVIIISNPISPKKGYIFTGWTASGLNTSTAQYGSSTSTANSWSNGSTKVTSIYFKNLANIGGTVTLTANYEAITYNVTYELGDGEWGSGAKYSNDVSYDFTFEVSNPIAPTGHIFAGWTAEGLDTSTAQYGSSSTSLSSWSGGLTKNRYFRNLSSTLDATVKFTANYDKEQYTINFDAGEGIVDSESIKVEYNETIDLPTPTPPAGYYFNGWEYSSSTYSGSYTVPDFGDNGTTVTFTADYVKEQYTIKFDAGAGTVSIQSKDVKYNEEIDLPTPTPPTGYYFNYWEYSNSTYSGSYTVPDFGEDGTTVTFTANYSKEQYTVIFNAGTGTVSPQSKNVSYNETIDLPTPTPPAGYYFNGWEYSSSTYSGSYTVPDFGDNGTTVTFTAQYEKQLYTVTLDVNGGVLSQKTLIVTYLGTYGEFNGNTLPLPTKQGYIFYGWEDVNNNSIFASTVYEYTKDTTIYARWYDTWINHVEQPEGQGSMSSPYLIKTSENLAWIARQAMLGYSTNYIYKQVANIDVYEESKTNNVVRIFWYPIGTETNPFTGTYYGNGYALSYSLYSMREYSDGNPLCGLFGYTYNAKLYGIFCDMAMSFCDYKNIAMLVYNASGNTLIKDCGISLSTANSTEGALVGYGTSSAVRVEDCIVDAITTGGNVSYKVAGGSTTVKSCVYIINNKKGYIGTDFSNYTYLQGMKFPLPKGLSWLAQGGKSCTLQDIINWVNE